ncbi:hypothetical protein LguiB_014070 [Lonicera macranthoides]
MDTNRKDCNSDKSGGGKIESVMIGDSEYVQLNGQREEEDESTALLQPRRGGLSKKPKKPRLKVQWNDRNGNKLAEVLEFQPR